MLRNVVMSLLILGGSAYAQNTAPPIPAGLWQSKDQGFVLRIEACGEGFCGIAVGAPPGNTKQKPEEMCGRQMLKDFKWNQKDKRWEGRMRPPNAPKEISSSVTTEGSMLTLRARMLFLSKTMSLVPFTGTIGEGCRIL